MEQEVWNRAAKDTVGQRSYYNSHPGDFMAGNRIFARLLGSGDTVFMKTVRQKVERGDSLTVAELRKLRTYTGFRNFGRGDSKVTDRIEWKAGLHETVVDNIRYLVEVKALVPPGRKTLEEARAEVVSGYQDLLEVNWIAVLRKKYPVRLDEKVLSMVTDRILRNKPGS
jgi:peptidyl-prolyl cis-trans isomerase SurA